MLETCQDCGGTMKIIPKALAALAGQALACIDDPDIIRKILDHLDRTAPITGPNALPEPRLQARHSSQNSSTLPPLHP
jgi:hypothetical protein